MISMISIMILSVVLIYFDISRADSSSLEPLGGQLLTGLGVFATGFVCHQIITPTLEALPVSCNAGILSASLDTRIWTCP